jgi:hypothetical protein
MNKKKYTLLTTAFQDHLIKDLNLNLNEPFNPVSNFKSTKPGNRLKDKKGKNSLNHQ